MRSAPVSLLMTFWLMLSAGCSESVDLEAVVDARVRDEWMQPGQYQDAVPFLENGGYYYNSPDGVDEAPLDQEAILPLLRRLRDEFRQPIHAIMTDDSTRAWSIVMPLPRDPAARDRVIAWIDAENAAFPGLILEEIGREWLTLDFLSETEERLIEQMEAEESARR